MITRDRLMLGTTLKYSWKNILFSGISALAAYVLHVPLGIQDYYIPTEVVSIFGVALAIILAFKNGSAYDRWWEARKIWGAIINDSRNWARQVITCLNSGSSTEEQRQQTRSLLNRQIAWIHALKLRLRKVTDPSVWNAEVGVYLEKDEYEDLQKVNNMVTHLGFEQGRSIKDLHNAGKIDLFVYLEMQTTLSRLVNQQGSAERIKNTPLPMPYEYYTRAFLYLFIFMFPFAFIKVFISAHSEVLVIPITIIVGWMFYQIYVFGLVLSRPFENWNTDVALDSITRTIEIDLKEVMKEEDSPKMLEPVKGVLT
ncbi:MAG: hydrogenase [Flavobacteriales bacterium]|nr:hydrogenase [Flavobacteriales bacterium]NNK80607.1 hydrogenase [Flavobacteriales bacterium]